MWLTCRDWTPRSAQLANLSCVVRPSAVPAFGVCEVCVSSRGCKLPHDAATVRCLGLSPTFRRRGRSSLPISCACKCVLIGNRSDVDRKDLGVFGVEWPARIALEATWRLPFWQVGFNWCQSGLLVLQVGWFAPGKFKVCPLPDSSATVMPLPSIIRQSPRVFASGVKSFGGVNAAL